MPGNFGAAEHRAKPVKTIRVDHFSGKLASVLSVLTKELRADNDRSRRRVSFCKEDRPIGKMKTGETAHQWQRSMTTSNAEGEAKREPSMCRPSKADVRVTGGDSQV